MMIISYDHDSLIFDMHVMMKMISRYYHSAITKISIKYQNSNSQSNDVLSRYFDKPQYCTLVRQHHFVFLKIAIAIGDTVTTTLFYVKGYYLLQRERSATNFQRR